MDYILIRSLLIAVTLGFIIGLQRTMANLYTHDEKKEAYFVAGSRTFALIALLGFLSGWLAKSAPIIVSIVAFLLVGLIILSYYLKAVLYKKMGMTSQIAAIITYLLGLMVYFHLEQYAIFIGILMIILLEIKPRLQEIEQNITPTDLNASILLLAMTFLILPILPDEMIGPYKLFNPYKTWLMAIIIASISFVGYVAIKILGNKRGVLLTGLFGGLISSTAVSISLSQMYTTQKEYLNNFAAGIAMACTLMYIRVLFEAFVINQKVALTLLLPYTAASLSGFIFVYILYKHSQTAAFDLEKTDIGKNPLQLSEAIKFGILFGVIYGAISIVQNHYGNIGVYIISTLSGITDVDAITLSLTQLATDKKLSLQASANGIVIASVTNSLVKLGIIYWIGGKRIGWRLTLFFLITLGMMGGGLWLGHMFFT
ncbi:MgtC/SapB family protein [Sulfurovum sp.]|uniref:MgtC/SapB family protein n=1 Tax=Sulfurovum sp. TaxID=1969726 RepID=UPI0025F8CBFF|nr:MgtC/SapB family protein [Sulfurovum sp.]